MFSQDCRGKAAIRVTLLASVAVVGLLAPAVTMALDLDYEASLGVGYRYDELRWDIAGTLAGTSPNILSELTWRDMESAQVQADVNMLVDNTLLLRGRGSYGEVQNGKAQDSDYNGDNRTLEFSRSNSESDGYVADVDVGVGYQFRVYDSSVERYARIIPMIGYARRTQHFTIFDGEQTVPAAGPIDGLHSTYSTEWEGPWLGLSIRMEADERTTVNFEVQRHWADFYAEANWNLRTDLAHPVSFVHETQGRGMLVAMELSHQWRDPWAFGVRLEWQDWQGEPGVDRIFDVSGASPSVLVTRLNGVDWEAFAASLSASYRF